MRGKDLSEKMLDKIDSRLEKIEESIGNIDKTLVKQSGELEHHIRRTEQNETLIESLKADFKPVQTHVIMVEGAFKILGILATGIAVLTGLAKLFGYIS